MGARAAPHEEPVSLMVAATDGGSAHATRVAAMVRSDDWWDYKLLTIVQLFAATAVMLRLPVWPMIPAAALVLAALVPGAVFASVINDLTDIEDDRRAGKRNMFADRPRWQALALHAGTASIGAAIIWAWRDAPMLCGVYLAAWLMFVAYSVPPVRIKSRGGWGVLAMGFGEAALPSLTVVLACFRAAVWPVDSLWIAAVGIWSLCHGVRAILWHQLGDALADERSAVPTFVQKRGKAAAVEITRRLVFPCELVALGVILLRLGSVLPCAALAGYLLCVWLRCRFWRNVLVVVAPVARHLYAMQDYYIAWLPAAIFLMAVLRHPVDGWIALLFLAIFPRAQCRIWSETFVLIRQAVGDVRHRLGRRLRS